MVLTRRNHFNFTSKHFNSYIGWSHCLIARSMKVLMRSKRVLFFFLLFPACDVAGSHGDMKFEMANARIGEVKYLGSGRSGHSSLDNGIF